MLCNGKELTDEILDYGLSEQKLHVNGTSPRVAQKKEQNIIMTLSFMEI